MKPWILSFLLLIPAVSLADGALDPASTEALQKTMNLLQSDAVRQEAITKSPDAQAADAQVKAIGGNQANTEAIYQLSSEVFEQLVQQTGGDPVKMQAIIQQAKDNPKAFYEKYFSAQDKAKLQNLSVKISPAPSPSSSVKF